MATVTNIKPTNEFRSYADTTNKPSTGAVNSFKYLNTHFDPSSGTQWTAFKSNAPRTITKGLIQDMMSLQQYVGDSTREALIKHEESRIKYHVLASEIPNIFNLGGDLKYLLNLIRKRDADSLHQFSLACVDLIYNNAVSFKLPITTITLLQGTALGGGFEAALSSNLIIAEKNCKISLPEVMFNMFPGMGAYHLLSRRISPALAEKIILSGKTYTAEEMHEIGVVDIVTDPGQGEEAVWHYIKRHQRQSKAEWSFRRMVNETTPSIKLEDLHKSVEHWVSTALGLSDNDLKHIEFLVRMQSNKSS